MSEVAISVRGLRKSYGEHEAVRGIDFEVASGEVFGFGRSSSRRPGPRWWSPCARRAMLFTIAFPQLFLFLFNSIFTTLAVSLTTLRERGR
ncbi:MAG TPA: hypothetical protein VFN89_05010 [Solirubrobacterales bacterium]|nr:hypothetical protein [Solirubrobacterales bacterium]